MSTEPFTDELLSAIIDGEADAATVASVDADPEASARLAQMRRAVDFVATPVPEATPERRRASIAAAMAAATPAAPEVTSLAAARHERTTTAPKRSESRGQWLVLAAAAVALIVAIPLVLQFRGGNDADTASDATTSDGETSFGVDASDDAAEATADVAEESGDSDDAMDEAASDDEGAAEEDAMEEEVMEEESTDEAADEADEAMADEPEDAAADDGADLPVSAADRLAEAPIVSNLEILEQFISTFGSITPVLTADQVIEVGVAPACVDSLIAEIEETTGEPFVDDAIFDLAFLGETGDNERLVIIGFLEDGTTIALDAEDCARLG